MLFGAAIEPLPDRNYRLVIQRVRASGAPVVWAVIVTESQDPLFDFLQFDVQVLGNDLRFRTRTTRFLEEGRTRWYGEGTGRLRMPADLTLDERGLLFWLLGSWAVTGKQVRLPLSGATPSTTSALRQQIANLTGWEACLGSDVLLIENRNVVERWLRARGVPERVWK